MSEDAPLLHVGRCGLALTKHADHQAGQGVLDGCGSLYQIGGGPEIFVDLILRREIGGATEIVYTEAMDPLVKIHISWLVTGS